MILPPPGKRVRVVTTTGAAFTGIAGRPKAGRVEVGAANLPTARIRSWKPAPVEVAA